MDNKKHNSDKYFYEERVRLILLYFFNSIYSKNILHIETPDVYDKDNNIGIEVTRAFYNNQGILSGKHNKFINKNIDEIPDKDKEHFYKLGAKIHCYNGKYAGYFRTLWASDNHIQKCFEEKLKKINDGHYKNCNQFDLFICTQNFRELEFDEMKELLYKLLQKQKDCNKKFRYVYIEDKPIIYQLNLLDVNLIQHILESNLLQLINDKAKIATNKN